MKPTNKLFFSSLKQVEKRLKLDDGNPPPPLPPPPPPPPPPETTQSQTTDSLSSSPIYFQNQHTTASSINSIEQPPQEFLSDNPKFRDSENNSPRIKSTIDDDDVDSMIRLLKLSDFDGKQAEAMPEVVGDDEFYDKIVGVKGPKCKKEVERLDGWIKYYLLNNDNGRGEGRAFEIGSFALAKAALSSDGNELEFPSTIDEFLHNDPPLD